MTSPASGSSVLTICIRASVTVAESAGRALRVHVGGASEALQEGIRSLCLVSQTLLSPFSQSHHHTNYPEDEKTDKKHIYIQAQYNHTNHNRGHRHNDGHMMSYLERAPRPRTEFWELTSLLSMAAILCSSEEVSSHIDCPLHTTIT